MTDRVAGEVGSGGGGARQAPVWLVALAVSLGACKGSPRRSEVPADAGGEPAADAARPIAPSGPAPRAAPSVATRDGSHPVALPPVPLGPDGKPDHEAWRRLVIDAMPLEPHRLDRLGLEVWLPADVRLSDTTGNELTIGTHVCQVYIDIDPPYRTPAEARDELWTVGTVSLIEERDLPDGWQQDVWVEVAGRRARRRQQVRTLGVTPVACTSDQPECVAWLCARLRALPGGAAEIVHPTDPPIITIHDRGGQGESYGGVEIRAGGDVHFFGPACPTWRGRTTTIAPARVAELVDAFDRSRPHTRARCFDCETTQVSVRDRDGGFQIMVQAMWPDESPPPPGAADHVLRAFYEEVGANPCRVTRTPTVP